MSFASNFTTNSVFADTYADYGAWGWLYTLALYPVAGYLFGRFIRYGPVVAGSGGVLAYCLSGGVAYPDPKLWDRHLPTFVGVGLLIGGRVRAEPAAVRSEATIGREFGGEVATIE